MTNKLSATERLERTKAGIAAEQERVDALIKRDKVGRMRERDRKAAEIEVGKGKTVSIGEAVDEPTPEWMEKGDTRTFTPKLEDGTVRTVTAYRRVVTPIVIRLHRDGRLTDDQARCCIWYRSMYDLAGIEGSVGSNLPRLTSGISGSLPGYGHMAKTELEAYGRQQFRAARDAVPAHLRRFVDAVAIDNIPLSRAVRFARCRNDKALNQFRVAVEKLVEYCESAKADIGGADYDPAS